MVGVAEHQLQRVLAWRQGDLCFCLGLTKMQVPRVFRDRLAKIWWRNIHEQVVVARIWRGIAGRGQSHAL